MDHIEEKGKINEAAVTLDSIFDRSPRWYEFEVPPKLLNALGGYRIFPYCFKEILDPRHQYRRVKHFVQRGRRGYSDSDLWNLGDYLLNLMHVSIRDFRMLPPHGVPGEFVVDEDGKEKDFEAGFAQWLSILKEIEDGLGNWKVHVEDCCDWECYANDHGEFGVAYHRAMKLIDQYLLAIWD